MVDTKIRKYEAINVFKPTKKRFDKLYYQIKVDKGYKSCDAFINDILDLFEKK